MRAIVPESLFPAGAPLGEYRVLETLRAGPLGTWLRVEPTRGGQECWARVHGYRVDATDAITRRWSRELKDPGRRVRRGTDGNPSVARPEVMIAPEAHGVVEGFPFVVVPAQGLSLGESRSRSFDEVLEAMLAVTESVDELHAQGRLHLAICADTVLCRAGRPWLLPPAPPPGLSKVQEPGSRELVSASQDVRALGGLLGAWVKESGPPHGRGDDLQRVLLRASARRPAARYPSVDFLLLDLRALRDGEPVVARPFSIVERVQDGLHRGHGALVAGAGLLLGIGLLVLLFQSPTRDPPAASERELAALAWLDGSLGIPEETRREPAEARDGDLHEGLTLLREGQPAAALERFRRAQEDDRTSPWPAVVWAEALASERVPLDGEAREFLVHQTPDGTAVWIARGRAMMANEDAEAALSWARRALERLPKSAAAWRLVIDAESELGRHGESMRSAFRAGRMIPSLGPAFLEDLGRKLATKGLATEARRVYEQALETHPYRVTTLRALADLARSEGRLERSRELFERILSIQPDHAEALSALGKSAPGEGRTR